MPTDTPDLYVYEGPDGTTEVDTLLAFPDIMLMESTRTRFSELIQRADDLSRSNTTSNSDVVDITALHRELVSLLHNSAESPIEKTAHLTRFLLSGIDDENPNAITQVSEESLIRLLTTFSESGKPEQVLPPLIPIILRYLPSLRIYDTVLVPENGEIEDIDTHKQMPECFDRILSSAIPLLSMTDYFQTLEIIIKEHPFQFLSEKVRASIVGCRHFAHFLEKCNDIKFSIELLEYFVLTFPGEPLCLSPKKTADIITAISSEGYYEQLPEIYKIMTAIVACGLEDLPAFDETHRILREKQQEGIEIATFSVFQSRRARMYDRQNKVAHDTTSEERIAGLFHEVLGWLPREEGGEFCGESVGEVMRVINEPQLYGYVRELHMDSLSTEYIEKVLSNFLIIFQKGEGMQSGDELLVRLIFHAKRLDISRGAIRVLSEDGIWSIILDIFFYYESLFDQITELAADIEGQKEVIQRGLELISDTEIEEEFRTKIPLGDIVPRQRSINQDDAPIEIPPGLQKKIDSLRAHEQNLSQLQEEYSYSEKLSFLETILEAREEANPGFVKDVLERAVDYFGSPSVGENPLLDLIRTKHAVYMRPESL